ncbi:DUF3040 domain-containing protein [Cellulomonas sp. zg-Y338]|uniref:DUF3040 domain-containing protein n=3 Tax=Cellulomonas chengniuliangii TaxID=2968084 RepID=A0ABY5KWL7_9CELL|nr:DUF3040 domain-containing protein [Cellulomonas chengniuliangii]MCC2309155.1 DUF3040 domain-containing protein [Cellulomonas chengniuliangii]MCC2319162.1 DUF3040 domain-containing protein [Cellulomonas chengniuliangii]MCC2319395.1 DUF3040 domain-containing protein [Cellulomonas chengniuliangii]UUI74130.1 DUF3040 domain-containing protein [Cellulomonas chengniuliangii]
MPLSEYEQRVLEQMERQLTSDDPRLANTLASRGRRSVGRYVLASAVAVAGLLMLVAGAATRQAWIGVLGFVIMFGAVAFGFTHGSSKEPANGKATPTQGKPAGSQKRQAGFMTRLEQRWQHRRDQGGR